MPPKMPVSKAQWRLELTRRLAKSPPTAAFQENMSKNLLQFFESQKGVWAAFVAMAGEPNLELLTRSVTSCQWVYPRISADQQMEFFIPDQRGFAKSSHGFLQPVAEGSTPYESHQISGFLIPGLGFDLQGNRLGRGQGYYDRYLARTKGIKVGVTYEAQMVDELPREAHDIRMDFVITEEKIYQF